MTAGRGTRWSAPLPLLSRELLELALRPRTYVVRSVYAVLLFVAFAIYLQRSLELGARGGELAALDALGIGRRLVDFIVELELYGIVLFLPGLVAGAIVREKENGSLTLLLLTDLSPWEIIVEKLVGRLVPMLSFLLLAFPALGVATAFGGVAFDAVWKALLFLVLASLQVASVALLASAFCSTAVTALAAAYLGVLALKVLPLTSHASPWSMRVGESGPAFGLDPVAPGVWGATALGSAASFAFSTAVFLLLARWALVARAFVRPRARLLGFFRALDRLMHGLNVRIGGYNLLRPIRWLPGDHPVAWRETTRTLGKVQYQVRVLVVLCVPTIAFGSWYFGHGHLGIAHQFLSGGCIFLWWFASAVVTVVAAGSISGERARETLDVLLTTPLAGTDIVRDKMVLVERYCRLLAVPVLILVLFQCGLSVSWPSRFDGSHVVPYLLGWAGLLLVTLRLFGWLGMLIGLRVRRRDRALGMALSILFLWIVVPVVAVKLFDAQLDVGWLTLSPGGVVLLLERLLGRTGTGLELPVAVLGIGLCMVLARRLQKLALTAPNRWLGRSS